MNPDVADAQPFKIYWLPGCSNCVRLKEHVTKRGFAFESVDLQAEPARWSELERLNIRGLPVITTGDRFAFGINLDRVDELLDVRNAKRKLLPVRDLVDRMFRVAGI